VALSRHGRCGHGRHRRQARAGPAWRARSGRGARALTRHANRIEVTRTETTWVHAMPRVAIAEPLPHNARPDAGWSSLAARRAHNPKVAGSNPAPATKKRRAGES